MTAGGSGNPTERIARRRSGQAGAIPAGRAVVLRTGPRRRVPALPGFHPYGLRWIPRVGDGISAPCPPSGRSPLGRARAGADRGGTGPRQHAIAIRFAADVARALRPSARQGRRDEQRDDFLDPPRPPAGRPLRGIPLPIRRSDTGASLVRPHENTRFCGFRAASCGGPGLWRARNRNFARNRPPRARHAPPPGPFDAIPAARATDVRPQAFPELSRQLLRRNRTTPRCGSQPSQTSQPAPSQLRHCTCSPSASFPHHARWLLALAGSDVPRISSIAACVSVQLPPGRPARNAPRGIVLRQWFPPTTIRPGPPTIAQPRRGAATRPPVSALLDLGASQQAIVI